MKNEIFHPKTKETIMQIYDKTKIHSLEHGFTLEPVIDRDEFLVNRWVYGSKYPFQGHNMDIYQGNDYFSDCDFWWVVHKHCRIGGVIMEPGHIGSVFTIPPYEDFFNIIRLVTQFQKKLKLSENELSVYDVEDKYKEYYFRLGYRLIKERKAMAVPSRLCDDISWSDKFEVRHLRVSDAKSIVNINIEAYKDTLDPYKVDDIDKEIEDTKNEIKIINKDKFSKESSLIVKYLPNDTYIGYAVVSLWNGLPIIDNIAVLHDYRRKGVAGKLIRHVINRAYGEYPVVRLFVTSGNGAEQVYLDNGFMPGKNYSGFKLKL